MHHVIPLHSLVLCDIVHRLDVFEPHEILDLATISDETVGSARQHDFTSIMYGELRHRIALKLSLGERAVVDLTGLTPDQRRNLTTIATTQGASAYAISQRSDYGAKHIRPNSTLQPVLPLPVNIEGFLRAKRFSGITVVADVHGEIEPLKQAFEWAQSRQHFVWLLGDIVDYGKQTLEVVDFVHHAVMHGEAAMVLANHERKIARWLDRDHEHLRISDGNRVTIDALDKLTARERSRWVGRFRALLAHASLMQHIGNFTLMHAAAHPSLWTTTAPEHKAIEQFALHGEADQSSGHYRRTHKWTEYVPRGKIVIVGHDRLADFPAIINNPLGGRVVFLDTGSGKGGSLSSADLRFHDNILSLECFKRH